MIFSTKKIVYVIPMILGVLVLIYGIILPGTYMWYQRKIYPFPNLSISQVNDNIQIFSPIGGSGQFLEKINHNDKRIIFTLTGGLNEMKPFNNFPINGLIGYKMCYENEYGQYCFGETK